MHETILEIAAPLCSARESGRDIVVTHRGTGTTFSMTNGAAVIWRDLAAGHSAESLIRLANGNRDLANSVERFVVELVDAGLMRKAATLPAPVRPAELTRTVHAGVELPALDTLCSENS